MVLNLLKMSYLRKKNSNEIVEIIKMEKIGYTIKFKQGDVEFKISGDKEFVMDLFEQFKDMLKIEAILSLSEETPLVIESDVEKEIAPKDVKGLEMPLDIYLNKYNTTGLQKKFLATALYLIEIKKQTLFRSREINNLLKVNNFEPFQASATHIQRLRKKGLISIVRKEGNESVITIFKDNIESVKNFIKKFKNTS